MTVIGAVVVSRVSKARAAAPEERGLRPPKSGGCGPRLRERGLRPLDRSEQLFQSWIQTFPRPREWSPVGSAKDKPVSGVDGYVPLAFVEESMMEPAQQDQIVQIGPASIGPVLDVMDLQPAGMATSREPTAASVTMIYETT